MEAEGGYGTPGWGAKLPLLSRVMGWRGTGVSSGGWEPAWRAHPMPTSVFWSILAPAPPPLDDKALGDRQAGHPLGSSGQESMVGYIAGPHCPGMTTLAGPYNPGLDVCTCAPQAAPPHWVL